MTPFGKQYFAYLVKQDVEVQFVWTDAEEIVSLSFYTRGELNNESTMSKIEARDFWNTMKLRLGYAKGVKCSTHLIK